MATISGSFVRIAFVALAGPMLLAAASLTIDHVTVAGANLKDMQARLAAVGIHSQYGGPHQNHATEMALVSFPDGSYLELIAIQPNADPGAVKAHTWARQMTGDLGPCAWAVRPPNLEAEIERLRAAGVTVGKPIPSGRNLPDGTRIDWETAQVGAEPNGTFFPFLIHDFTPRAKRAYPSGKPTTRDFSGVAKVVIAVRDLNQAIGRFRQAFGVPEPIKQVDAGFGAQLALLGDTPVVLAAPLNSGSWLAERLDQAGEGPCAFLLKVQRRAPYKTAESTRWFGMDVSWFDPAALGWRLGFE
jgi:hypothetical protein